MEDFCKAEYHIPNTDITIEFSRWKKPFSFIQSAQYECHIKFTNFTGQILVDIPCNEKYLVDLMQSLYDWDSFSGQYQFGILLNSISKSGFIRFDIFIISGSGVLSFEDNTLTPND